MKRLSVLSALLPLALIVPTTAFGADAVFQTADEGSITVDGTFYHDIKPDSITGNVSCTVDTPGSEVSVNQAFGTLATTLQGLAGTTARVRKTSGYTSQYYGDGSVSVPSTPIQYTGSVTFTIRDLTKDSAMAIEKKLLDIDCTATWDARVINSAKYVRLYKDQLMQQINDEKAFYEDLLGKKLTKVSYASFSTGVDYSSGGGYGSNGVYDPESDTVPVITTLSFTFDIGNGKKTTAQ